MKHVYNVDGLLSALKFVHEMFVDIAKFFFSSAELVHKMRSFSFTGFYNGSYQE
jgi:hypothetical protein